MSYAEQQPSQHVAAPSNSEEPAVRYRFGPFEMRSDSLELLRDGERIKLQHQPSRLLELFLRHAPNLVERGDIRRHLWGDDTVLEVDQGINFCVRQIRAVLGESAGGYIETVPRSGYRFVCPVTVEPFELRVARRTARPARWLLVAAAITAPTLGLLGMMVTQRPAMDIAATTAVETSVESSVPPELQKRYREARRQAVLHGSTDAGALRRSIVELEEIVSQAPHFADAHATLSHCYLSSYGLYHPREAAARAQSAADRALQLAPEHPDALISAGVALRFSHRWQNAEDLLRRALEIAPRSARALREYGQLQGMLSRPEEAIHYLEQAFQLNPVAVGLSSDLAFYTLAAGRPEEAEARARALIEQDPANPLLSDLAAFALEAQGRDEAALQVYNRLFARHNIASASSLDGARLELLVREKARARRGEVRPTRFAVLLTSLGRYEEAAGWLLEACRERSSWMIPFSAVEPRLAPLRATEQWPDVAACLDLPTDVDS